MFNYDNKQLRAMKSTLLLIKVFLWGCIMIIAWLFVSLIISVFLIKTALNDCSIQLQIAINN